MKHETENSKKIIQSTPEKFHSFRTSGHTSFVLHQSNKIKPANAITKSEFQKVTFFSNPRNQRHLEKLAMLF